MIGRWAIKPIARQIVVGRNLVISGRTENDRVGGGMCRHGLQRTNRKQGAVFAVLVLLCIGTARHVAGH